MNPTSDYFQVALDLKSQELAQCNKASFDYRGQSMFPLFLEDDSVVIKPYLHNSPKIGDVIVFERNGHLVLHRLIKIAFSRDSKTLVYTCKGDNCLFVDAPIAKTQILGKATLIQRQTTEIKLDCVFGRLAQKLMAYISRAELRCGGKTQFLSRARASTCSFLKAFGTSPLISN